MEAILKPNFRKAFGKCEEKALLECIQYYRNRDEDPPYDGYFQKKYQSSYSEKMGGGYSIAINTGSSACYLAILSLELDKGSKVLLSPVTDTSSLISIIMAGLKPVIVDTKSDSYNASLNEFMEAYSDDVSAIYLVHTYGSPADIVSISDFCKRKKIKLIEDCSQSPFAYVNINGDKKFVGSFGDVAATSTMYRKTLQTSSSGGIFYTKNYNLYKVALEYSDRGRPKWDSKFNPREPGNVSRIGLNLNTSEFSCSIGLASLARVDEAIETRTKLISYLYKGIKGKQNIFKGMDFPIGSSPFLVPIIINLEYKREIKNFLYQLKKYEIPHSYPYNCFVYDWEITKSHIKDTFFQRLIRKGKRNIYSNNAEIVKSSTINIFLHEGYTEEYVDYIVRSLV